MFEVNASLILAAQVRGEDHLGDLCSCSEIQSALHQVNEWNVKAQLEKNIHFNRINFR